jgi:hypothetical protein
MRDYSVCYLDTQGRTQGSEFLPFADNKAAVAYARIGMVVNAIVEVWKGGDLVARLYRDAPQINLPGLGVADSARQALGRAEPRARIEDWDNEGGAARRQPLQAL